MASGAKQGIQCSLRKMADVVLKDRENKIKGSGKWPLLIDLSGQAATFLKYRDANYICALESDKMSLESLRMALLGAIRFGRMMVIDMMEADLFDMVEGKINEIQPNLMSDLLNKKLLEDEGYLKLVKPSDPDDYQIQGFQHDFADSFMFILVTQKEAPSDRLLDLLYPIRIMPN